MAHLADFDTSTKYKATVLKSERMTPDKTDEIREIQIEVKDPEFQCEIDQSFGVLVKSKNVFGTSMHHRLYSVADLPDQKNGSKLITMLVKRCSYVDEFSGELYKGVASNYLCNRRVGDEITITGPHHLPFKVPEDKTSNLILVGMGTGIAPFRAFIKHLYKNVKDWKGQVRLFYGAKSGLELLYLNDKDGDMTQYYDEGTFKAFHAVSPRPAFDDPIALDVAMEDRASEILEMLQYANTHIYVAGYEKIKGVLDKAFASIMGSPEAWKTRKAELIAGGKWAEVIY